MITAKTGQNKEIKNKKRYGSMAISEDAKARFYLDAILSEKITQENEIKKE